MPDDVKPADQPVAERLHGIVERLREKLIAAGVFDEQAARDLTELARLAAALVPPQRHVD